MLHSALAIAETTKAERVQTALKIVNKVYEFAGLPFNKDTQKAFSQKFLPILQEVDDPQTLASISLICYELAYPMKAGDGAIDSYFDDCFNSAMFEISKIKGPEATEALRHISEGILMDGANSLSWKLAATNQQKISAKK